MDKELSTVILEKIGGTGVARIIFNRGSFLTGQTSAMQWTHSWSAIS
ncbi:MAG: hypothetical protein HYU31_14170 [Deltaproteobacteria bacterium]|nr:hypothetical protein [Deltaproteobacteria bacterium]